MRFCLLIFLLSCSSGPLSVQNYYFTSKDLASMHVGTPDPALDSPSIGQRLIVRWRLNELPSNVFLLLSLRFRNREDESKEIPLRQRKGKYIYELRDEEYLNSRGLLAYKAEIWQGDDLIHEWVHQVWAPRINY